MSCPSNRLPNCALAVALLAAFALSPLMSEAGEGGTTHVIPGAMSTISDLPATSPGWFVKPMYLNYDGEASARIPTAAGIASNLSAEVDTVALAFGRTFETTVLGGAHYTAAIAQPYAWLDVTASVDLPIGPVAMQSKVDGLGDLTLIPAMLAWKYCDWQFNAMLPVYAPTGDYEKGRLGNPGLNYWTVDPTVGALYSNRKSGFNAMAHLGYSMNTENSDTDYESGSMLHAEVVIQQMLPMGPGFLSLGAEGFWFEQMTADRGDGATLGDFEGMTRGAGPVLGYILPMGKEQLVTELKWLDEIDTEKRLEGEFVWLKMVYKF